MQRRFLLAVVLVGRLAPVVCGAEPAGVNVPAARFRGAATRGLTVANVACESATQEYCAVTFDLSSSHSWRAIWDVGPEQHGGSGTLKIENWDAAWLFVKFRKSGADGWSHATLSTKASDHAVPAGAALEVGLTDDGQRGLGVFVYRNGPGSGPHDWKGVKLRWLHRADGVPSVENIIPAGHRPPPVSTPGKSKAPQDEIDLLSDPDDDSLIMELEKVDAIRTAAAAGKAGAVEIRICAISMVYVPECAFWAGDGTTNGIAGQFSAGDGTGPFRIESEAALTLGGNDRKNLGNRDGLFAGDDFTSSLTRTLPGGFPKGYAAFYCMKNEITRGELVAFLNTLNSGQQAAMKEVVGAGNNGIKLTGSGILAKYETEAPHAACDGLAWREGVAYAAWAGLRPMTELEFEKACRGPLKPVPNEYAWGTNGDRVRAGASYWGILALSDGLGENTVTVGTPIGRHFTSAHGDGAVGDLGDWNDFNGRFENEDRHGILANPPGWAVLGAGLRLRGGSAAKRSRRVSDRGFDSVTYAPARAGNSFFGFRCVRSAGADRSPAAADEDAAQADSPQSLFNEQLRIANVAVVPRDKKTATIKFDITWDNSWRNATNHDAAWVFFKARAKGEREWRHVRLAADPPPRGSSGAASKVVKPTGYSSGEGTPLEFIVPDGPDGFSGLFVQRAANGAGPVTARGVTVVAEWGTNIQHPTSNTQHPTPNTLNPEHRTLNTAIQAFGIEMVYVPEGPFYLGSGGTEPNRFYKYTDGSQNTLPYQVTDAGPIPTGPQEGRLWATGIEPDGTDAGEISAVFPKGYRAFYCMKYQLKQGQFAAFLGMQSEIHSFYHAYRPGNCPPLAKVGSAFLKGLTWAQGAAFGAWAGLRPMTELEFEKACRGPLKPVPDEIGLEYWGIRELNLGGLVQRVVSVGSPDGRRFAGTHGRGSTTLPTDWPQGGKPAVTQRGGGPEVQLGYDGPFDLLRTSWRNRLGSDGDLDGWRGVRTAAPTVQPLAAGDAEARDGFKLELDPLPNIGDLDIAIFDISGRFHNAGARALPVELVSPLPDACFPEGAASRAFTASPKTATEFKILTVVTRRTARAVRRVQACPVRIRKQGGEVLAEAMAKLALSDPLNEKAPVIGTFDGGKVPVRIGNTTAKPRTLTIEMQPPPGLVIAEASRRIDIAAGKPVVAEFPANRRDASLVEGFYNIPYRIVPANGAAQAGVTTAELRMQSRWWVGRREIRTGPAMNEDMLAKDDGMDLDGLMEEIAPAGPSEKEKAWDMSPADVFKANRPKGWQTVKHGASLWVRQLKPQPKAKTIVSAATRVIASAEREAVIKVGMETDGWTWLDSSLLATIDGGSSPGFWPFAGRIWVNGEIVRDSRPDLKQEVRKSVQLRKGANSVLVQFEAAPDAKGQLANVFLLFHDAKDGTRIDDLVFDVEAK